MEEARWAGLGSAIASLMFLWAVARQYLPSLTETHLAKYTNKVISLIYPYILIKFPEYTGDRLKRSEAYTAIDAYLSSVCTATASRLRVDVGESTSNLFLSMDDNEEVTIQFRGAKLWWSSLAYPVNRQPFSHYAAPDEKRYYQLAFHRRHRDLIHEIYLPHVMEEGRAAGVKRRQRKLYTNNPTSNPYARLWSHVPFEHPATFETVAMDFNKKQEIMQDLITFSKSKDYYARIGKAWKRGYLLYGPPGTGKSSLVAAIANFLDYDVYDVELTVVSNNTALRKLLIETSSKSVIVIEDIDCSLDFTGKRKEKEGSSDQMSSTMEQEREKDGKVTLSGLLNFIDGLWSSCGGERVIVFTTNYVERLDPALIRRGRMDKHIELSYCSFEAFKVLARNYLQMEEHPLYGRIRELIEQVKITPADVAENLMPKVQDEDAERVRATCLQELIGAMEAAKARAEEAAEA